jgi:uncharacterized protein (DUF736 family)
LPLPRPLPKTRHRRLCADPDRRQQVYAGLVEIGVAWLKTSRGGDPYYAVKLDDPSFAKPIWANMVESQKEVAVHNLLWDRPARASSDA